MAGARSGTTVWPILHYRDVAAALVCLVDVLGFRPAVVARDANDRIAHAELDWPTGGTVLVGSADHTGGVHGDLQPGGSAMYVPTDDVAEIHQRASDAGLPILQRPHTTQFGNGVDAYACTLRDTEGYLWTFGDYRGG